MRMPDGYPADDMRYRRLSDLPALEVADDSPDVRGWDVTAAGERIGKVVDLLIDADQLTAVCLLVEPAASVAPPAGSLYLVPVDTAEVIRETRLVTTPLGSNELTLAPVETD